MKYETFMDLAKSRFSVRKFSDRTVETEKLTAVLDAARIAPTAKNLQPWRIYVVQSEGSLAKLSGLTHCTYGAKTVLLFTYNVDEDWKNPLEEGIHSGVEDVCIAATHAMLEATEQGLSTCWCNYFPNRKLEEALGIPKNERSVVMMPIGYAADSANPTRMHTESKTIDELVRFI